MEFLSSPSPRPDLPLFVYLPGMDGSGQLLRSQLANLKQSFDVRRLSIPVDDLSDWSVLVAKLKRLINSELADHQHRTVYVCGESFGGCLALKLAIAAPDLCDRLILINSASSFRQQALLRFGANFTQLLPASLYRFSCLALLPFLAAMERIGAENRSDLLAAMQAVDCQTAMWRVALLNQFDVTMEQLRNIRQPTLVISSGRDRLLPSVVEGKILIDRIPLTYFHLIPDSGHAALLETGVDLHEILSTSGFLEQQEEELLSASRSAVVIV
jgi:pimeloyl-ACP methyl ester carboxylesterase